MLADYGTTGLTAHAHPLALLRHGMPAGTVTSRDLEALRHGTRVRVGGLVVARQRPGTANGIVFVLLEDEHGTINLIVPPAIYERHRLTVRTEPLMLVGGRLERFAAAGGAINILVDSIDSLATPDRPLAEVKDFSMLDERERHRIAAEREAAAAADREASAAEKQAHESAAEDFRAVAPAVMSFGAGRRR
jgi:error-prone DNA polymerase